MKRFPSDPDRTSLSHCHGSGRAVGAPQDVGDLAAQAGAFDVVGSWVAASCLRTLAVAIAARREVAARTQWFYSGSMQRTRVPDHALVQLRRARDHADRHFAEPLDLDHLASVAALSKYHFHRLFTATYGRTPAAHLSRRRIERAQDLLRSTNLTVTEVCFAVGFSSLGSFSTRFAQIVGESPRAFQHRYGGNAPRIPGCYLFMSGYLERNTASEEKPAARSPS